MEHRRDLLAEAHRAALEAADVLLESFGRLGHADARRKGGRRRDLVSEADLNAERRIRSRIPESDGILAEEEEDRESRSGVTWVVDPLDGTVNFLHGLPLWCVSLAILERERPVAAVVHSPALGWTFTAASGSGSRLNGEPVSVSSTAELSDAILATGFPYARDRLADNNLANVERIGLRAGGIRRLGSAALDLALVACGRLDGFWELHLEPWDVAAGLLLVREAGGESSDFRGRTEFERLLHGRNVVATNGPLHEELRTSLAPLREL